MTLPGLVQLLISTVLFLLAATAAKGWALAPSPLRLMLVLALYSLGNLVMLRLIRDFGMGVALSLSAVVQLIAVNVVAMVVFGEQVGSIQGWGIVLAIFAVALLTLGPYLSGR